MGPPPFGDGYRPSPRQPWIGRSTLQWGHRLSAMDTFAHLPGFLDRRLPSMGPPPFGDGYPFRPAKASITADSLQWGHRLSAMDTGVMVGEAPDVVGPSMGPPPFGDGYEVEDLVGRRTGPPSMGPPPFGDGYGAAWTASKSRSSTLQWGHRLSAMDTCAGRAVCAVKSANLQWGHRLSAMDTIQNESKTTLA